jgi:outer membrane protein OmpA-like peptidoglycan-associated protein
MQKVVKNLKTHLINHFYQKDSDGDGLIDREDLCPNERGTTEFAGCPDKDGDKIPDYCDKCPEGAGWTYTSGCPDADKDTIADTEDACPQAFGLRKYRGCPDKDGDGIVDKDDACPDKPGPITYNGCPDTDKDGIPDNEDECPAEFGYKDRKGCPVRDTDGDGLLDTEDKCPETPGPKTNFGCPVNDQDGDGVPDKTDECPHVPGPADNKGCPKLAKEEQEILNTAFSALEFETGKDIIRKSSYPSLNELATLLIKKPQWKIKLSGHTDNQGNAKANLLLSKKRATAVKKYLATRGVEAVRIKDEGFGQSKPVASNKTTTGRQRNRRVEMKVLFE